MIELRPHQIEAIAAATEQPYIILNHSLRSGKTITALTYAKGVGKPLVVTHPNLIGHWEREAKRVGLDPVIVSWTKLKNLKSDEMSGIAGFIVDEAHLFKNHRSKRSKDLLRLIIDLSPSYILLLTGTPFKEGRNISLYSLLNLLGHPLAVDYSGFVNRFSDPNDLTVNRNSEGLLKACAGYIHTYNTPVQETQLVYVRERLWTPPKPQNPTDWMSALQMESVKKIPLTFEKISELENSHTVVFTWFQNSAVSLHEALTARGLSATLSTGAVTISERDKRRRKWKEEGGVLVGTIAANCEGIDLSEGETLIMHDLCFEETKNTQALKRCDTYHEECQDKRVMGASWLSDLVYAAFEKKVDLNPLNISEFSKVTGIG